MSRPIERRIAFYTRKVADRTVHHPSRELPPNFINRNKRLALYKSMLHQEIKANLKH